MSNEQKLREIICKLLDRVRDMDDCGPPGETWQSDELIAEIAEAEQALATTAPVMANGLSQSRDSLNKLVDIMRWVDAYAYDYAKEGKFAKSRQQVEWSIIHELNKISPTSKQSLQVEPAVNQQLTTELDEREAFESEMRSRHGWNNSYFTQSNDGGYLSNRATHAYIGWQARADMAKGVK